MNVLAENGGKTYVAATIGASGDLVLPFHGIVFPCLVWDHDGESSEALRDQVATALVRAGCRYAVCAGRNCEEWHDAVDCAFLREHPNASESTLDAMHVMTTWHADESPSDIAFFFVQNTNFDAHDFAHYLVLHVGEPTAGRDVDLAVQHEALKRAV